MADKTSWTKPLARMTYGDSIVGMAWLEAGTVGGAGSHWSERPPCSGTQAFREGGHEGVWEALCGPIWTRAQSRAWPRPAGRRCEAWRCAEAAGHERTRDGLEGGPPERVVYAA
jgi:hypothetical protein